MSVTDETSTTSTPTASVPPQEKEKSSISGSSKTSALDEAKEKFFNRQANGKSADTPPKKTAEDVVAKLVPKEVDPNKVIATMTVKLVGEKGSKVEVDVDDPNAFSAGRFVKHQRRIILALNKLRTAKRLANRKERKKR